jgi:phosphodiesterase/alkaline phosphatase D-like protein
MPEHDSFSAFGAWLLEHFSQRDTLWPHLLLLIGDQIYADEPSTNFLQLYPDLQKGAQTFENFASMYTFAWTMDEQVRQIFAALPTYMILDDHEITNNFNISPTWRARALRKGKEHLLVDGLVAYWIYQGWGNLYQRDPSQHPLLRIMYEAALSGEDALEALRTCISSALHEQTRLTWHYEIPTTPSIFVMDVRVDRPAIFNSQTAFTETPASIMHSDQMQQLALWLYENQAAPAILVSSVPILLPPLIGLAEYLMGIRPWYKSIAPLRWLGRQVARVQHKLAMGTSFDHWPVFNTTWRKLIDLLGKSRQDILVLSGDVHFSYAMQARRTKKSTYDAHMYQFVSTPLQNELSSNSRKLVLRQARLHRATYGGLHTRMLPMYTSKHKQRVPHDMLLQTNIALVTLQSQAGGKYQIQQVYLGFVEDSMDIVGQTIIEQYP